MRKNYFILLLLLSSFIIFTETFAENEKPDAPHENQQVQLEENIKNLIERSENLIERLENTLNERSENTLKKYSEKHESVIQKYIEEHKSINNDFKNRADAIGSVTNTIAVVIAIIVGIIAFLTFLVSLAVPHYYLTMNALGQTEKRLSVQRQLDSLTTRIQFGFVQQMLERSSRKTEDNDETDSTDSAKNVEAAYVLALQIRSTLEEIRSGGKDVNVKNLCGVLQQLSVMDTEKSWTKDIREYLHLLLCGEFLADDIAKQAVNDLLRNL